MTNNKIPESNKQAFVEFVERAGLCRPAEWYLERVTENAKKNPHGGTGLYNLRVYGQEEIVSENKDYIGPLTPFLQAIENVMDMEVYQHGYDSPFCDEMLRQEEHDKAHLVCLDAWRKADHEAFRKYEHDRGYHIRFGDEEITADPRQVDVKVAGQIAEILHRWINQAVPEWVSTENLPRLPIWDFSHPVGDVLLLITQCFSFQPTRMEEDMWMYAYYCGDEKILSELRLIDQCLTKQREILCASSDKFETAERRLLIREIKNEDRDELHSHVNKIRSLLGFEDLITAQARVYGEKWKQINSRVEG
ncbi:hypothetical protein K3555_18375 [Leisingera sp. M527]|uniref:hypothetical protein n=1 Tax=Leisingera sp. M527 TaxID=2867014 RepID=UPI0021A2D609|nr:hypothetical protein [Leisingera sp. M527]UWQ32470.1 hypothetical protein K3555_18375 [Leisingera sp. M527]